MSRTHSAKKSLRYRNEEAYHILERLEQQNPTQHVLSDEVKRVRKEKLRFEEIKKKTLKKYLYGPEMNELGKELLLSHVIFRDPAIDNLIIDKILPDAEECTLGNGCDEEFIYINILSDFNKLYPNNLQLEKTLFYLKNRIN